MMNAKMTLEWNGPKLLELIGEATTEAKAESAELIAKRSKEIIRQFRLPAGETGGFGKVPGYVESVIEARPFSVEYGFPAYQVQYGTARSAPRDFIWRSVEENRDRIFKILFGSTSKALLQLDREMRSRRKVL